MSELVPEKVSGTLCNERIGHGMVAYPCSRSQGHLERNDEPHYAVEVASSRKAWSDWKQSQSQQAIRHVDTMNDGQECGGTLMPTSDQAMKCSRCGVVVGIGYLTDIYAPMAQPVATPPQAEEVVPAQSPSEIVGERDRVRSWEELRESGLLWYINRALFHPRGFALGVADDGSGWMLLGDGNDLWRYGNGVNEDDPFEKVQHLLMPREDS